MAQSTLKVVVILTAIFLTVVGTSWFFATTVSSEADVVTVDSNQGPSTAKVALTIVPSQPASADTGAGG